MRVDLKVANVKKRNARLFEPYNWACVLRFRLLLLHATRPESGLRGFLVNTCLPPENPVGRASEVTARCWDQKRCCPQVLSERLQAGDVAPRRPLQQTQLEKLLSEQVADVDLAYVVRCTENWSDGQMIGEGAYGKVYKGVDKDGTEAAHFAVKRQRCPDDIAARHRLERMRRAEIDTLTHVTHPNIIRLLGYSSGDEDTVLIYEFGQQGSLERTLREDELAAQLGWAWRVRIARGIVAGVQHLHEQQFYHRDVQPAHVVLMEDFTPKLTAFGLSRPFREMDCANEVPKGTPGFMCRHYITTRKFDQKSEVYSVGVTVLQPSGISSLTAPSFSSLDQSAGC